MIAIALSNLELSSLTIKFNLKVSQFISIDTSKPQGKFGILSCIWKHHECRSSQVKLNFGLRVNYLPWLYLSDAHHIENGSLTNLKQSRKLFLANVFIFLADPLSSTLSREFDLITFQDWVAVVSSQCLRIGSLDNAFYLLPVHRQDNWIVSLKHEKFVFWLVVGLEVLLNQIHNAKLS
jgi:hypothetical protein